MALESDLLPFGRAGGLEVNTGNTGFASLGPFPGGGVLGWIGVGWAAFANSSVRFSFVISASPEATLVNWDSSSALMEPGATVIGNKPAWVLPCSQVGIGTWATYTFWRPVRTGPQYLLFAALNNTGATLRMWYNGVFGVPREGVV